MLAEKGKATFTGTKGKHMKEPHIAELVRWRAKDSDSDRKMAQAVDRILPELKALPGFISQDLYKDDAGGWAAYYIWETREDGVASNDLMAPKESFQHFMGLIDLDSVSIEFLSLPQS